MHRARESRLEAGRDPHSRSLEPERDPQLEPSEQAIVDEEEQLLARARAAIAEARLRAGRRPRGELRSVEALRELREEAKAASADDLPALLHEMSVRQRLLERDAEPALPDVDAPYLAHLRVREGGATRDYLLGHASLLDGAAGVRIVDWRVAPVAQIFYRHREGDEYEAELPGRIAEGRVEARRIVVIERGELSRILGDGLVLTRGGDGAWSRSDRHALALEGGGAGAAARPGALGVGAGDATRARGAEVTALLDGDQFAAVCAPAEEPLVVLGSAGSGKTTVALHRLARIATREPETYPLARTRVIVPEEGLARLSRRLLEPLGVGAAQVETLDAWAVLLARRVFGELPRLCADAPGLVASLKRHPALHRALAARFAKLTPGSTTLRRLRKKLSVLFTDRAFLAEVVAASARTLPASAIEETVRHTLLQLAEPVGRQLASIVVPEMKRAVDGRPVAEGTPDDLAGTLDVEDLPILLFLRALHAGLPAPEVAHLVVDEAEDFSPFELHALGALLGDPRSVTLAGDELQQTSSCFAGWEASLELLRVRGASTVRLAISYRCPEPIASLAHAVLGPLAPDEPARAARGGVPVGRFRFADPSQAELFVAGAVGDLIDREPRASVAVIARDAEAARDLFALLADRPEARLVLEGEFSFDPGVDVTHVDAVKGLEFDYVVVPDASAAAYPATSEARRRLHVALTRAAHQLWLVAGGAPTPLAPFAD